MSSVGAKFDKPAKKMCTRRFHCWVRGGWPVPWLEPRGRHVLVGGSISCFSDAWLSGSGGFDVFVSRFTPFAPLYCLQ